MSSVDCIYSHIIPANPDISGYGVRVAIYIQNLLSFIPAFYALMDGKISVKELQVVEKQSTTILITAFAVLISAMVQAGTYGLYSFHTSIILSLSWMNNTNTFIYFLLYIHHKIDLDLDPSKRVEARWSAWFYHVVEPFGIHRRNTKDTGNDAEASSPAPGSTSSRQNGEKNPSGESLRDSLSEEKEVKTSWIRSCWSLLRRKFVLVLGSLHLTAMAALGIWMWSSPYRYEATQAHHLHLPQDLIPLHCTNTTLFGSSIPLTSTALNRTSLIFYSVFLAPCLNLIVPAVFFLLMFMRYGTLSSDSTAPQKESILPSTRPLFVNALVYVVTEPIARFMRFMKSAWPIFTGLSVLLAINIVFIVDIETTIDRSIPYQDAKDESNWTFGQTLALLLLVLPMRDVYDYIKENREAEYAVQCTEDLKLAVSRHDLKSLRVAAKHADNVHAYIAGEFPFALQFAAYKGDLNTVEIILERNRNINVEGVALGGNHVSPLVAAASLRHECVVKALIKTYPSGAALDIADNNGLTALHHAARHGLKDAVACLLENGSKTEARSHAGLRPLHSIAESGPNLTPQDCKDVIIQLVDHDAEHNIDQINDNNGWTPLIYAAHHGRVCIVEILLQLGAKCDYGDNKGKTSLIHTASQGHEPIVRLLLEHSANVNQAEKQGKTPLIWAAHEGHEPIVRLLLDHSADVNQAENDGSTPLIWAAHRGHEPIVRLLLEQNTDVNQAEKNGKTPLIWAAHEGHEPIVRLLLEHSVDVNQTENDGKTPLIWAVSNGHEPIMRILLEHGADVNQAEKNGKTPLIWAAHEGHEPIVRLLLEHGVDVNQTENDGKTPLIWAVSNGHEPIMRILLEHGANVNQAEKDGKTPLIWAAFKGHEPIVRLLLEYGADVNQTENDGKTPLMWAARKGHELIVWPLLEHGANVNQADHSGMAPLIWAAREGQEPIVRLLLEYGANVNQATNNSTTPLMLAAYYGQEPIVRLLLDHSADVSQADYKDTTPLIRAAYYGHEPIVRLLLDHSADVNQADNIGTTPLIRAAYMGRILVMHVLLDSGANLEHASNDGRTALLHAVQRKEEAAVQLLLQRGADFTKVDNDGQTALGIAREKGDEAIVALLEDAGARRESQGRTNEVLEPTLAHRDGEKPSSVSLARTGSRTGGV